MSLKKTRTSSRSIADRCSDIRQTIHRNLRHFVKFLYNSDRREILGRDGQRWIKLATFYFFFYIALAGFFCLCLSIFMLFLPLDQPRYSGKTSRMTSRANPLTPGLSFRPMVEYDPHEMRNLIRISSTNSKRRKRTISDPSEIFTKSLDEFFKVYRSGAENETFKLNNVGSCTSSQSYGYKDGKPCLLIKMNKIVGFLPEPGQSEDDGQDNANCSSSAAILVKCRGENPVDQDMLGNLKYYSETGVTDDCGSISTNHFPYRGKENRKDIYQAPYVWVQFMNLTENVLIAVECRIFGKNIFYDRSSQRGAVRFQLYLD